MFTSFEEIFEHLRSKSKKRLVAAWAVDDHTINAVRLAIELGIVEGTLVGDENMIKAVCEEEGIDPSIFNIVHNESELKSIAQAVDIINAGEGDILMKGLCSTDKYSKSLSEIVIHNSPFEVKQPSAIINPHQYADLEFN